MTSGDQEIHIRKVKEADAYLAKAVDLLPLGDKLIFRVAESVLETHRERLRATFPVAVLCVTREDAAVLQACACAAVAEAEAEGLHLTDEHFWQVVQAADTRATAEHLAADARLRRAARRRGIRFERF